MQGLTDGISSRYLRGNRSSLLPSLESMRLSKSAGRSKALHGRLEELLVFEICEDGRTEYHRFTVRTLHKYVLKAIKNTKDSPNVVESFASGRAIINQPLTPAYGSTDDFAGKEIDKKKKRTRSSIINAMSPAGEEIGEERARDMGGAVTYRELLGGFLHPRDMRKLVTPFSASNEPELIVRRHGMLLNFDPLRAIILRDRLLVLVPDGADSILVRLEQMVLGNSEIEGDGMFGSNPSLADMIKEQDNDNINQEEEIYFEAVTEHPDSLQLNDLGNTQAGNPDFVVDLDFKTYEWAEMEGRNWIDLPFELQSVDAILNSVCSILADNVLDLQLSANKMITELLDPGADVGDHAQEVLRTMKNSVKEMVSRVNGFCRAIDTTLDDFEDMALMNLTRLLTHPDRFIQPVPQSVLDEESDEPELILEAHLQRGHTLTNALSLVQGQIHSTEEFAVQKSDNVRNRLLYINMMISLLSLSVSGAGFVGSIFGMNVENPLEESSTAFFTLTFSTIGASLFFVIFVLFLIRRLGALPRVF